MDDLRNRLKEVLEDMPPDAEYTILKRETVEEMIEILDSMCFTKEEVICNGTEQQPRQ